MEILLEMKFELSQPVTYTRYGGYECSSAGDTRFSAFYAMMPDGRSIEHHYQCDVKGYDPGGTNWKLAKGKPPKNPNVDLWREYKKLWDIWAENNPDLIEDLARIVIETNQYVLSDQFANTDISQARALADILNDKYWMWQ